MRGVRRVFLFLLIFMMIALGVRQAVLSNVSQNVIVNLNAHHKVHKNNSATACTSATAIAAAGPVADRPPSPLCHTRANAHSRPAAARAHILVLGAPFQSASEPVSRPAHVVHASSVRAQLLLEVEAQPRRKERRKSSLMGVIGKIGRPRAKLLGNTPAAASC